jgi:hypothetical protein
MGETRRERERESVSTLHDMEKDVEKAPGPLRSSLNMILSRIIEKRIGYYLEKPDEYGGTSMMAGQAPV